MSQFRETLTHEQNFNKVLEPAQLTQTYKGMDIHEQIFEKGQFQPELTFLH